MEKPMEEIQDEKITHLVLSEILGMIEVPDQEMIVEVNPQL
jgi:hypothetical protein